MESPALAITLRSNVSSQNPGGVGLFSGTMRVGVKLNGMDPGLTIGVLSAMPVEMVTPRHVVLIVVSLIHAMRGPPGRARQTGVTKGWQSGSNAVASTIIWVPNSMSPAPSWVFTVTVDPASRQHSHCPVI